MSAQIHTIDEKHWIISLYMFQFSDMWMDRT